MNPHLINGYKYHLRVLVAVTSFNPLKVYVYKRGWVIFAAAKWSSDPKHLSIQRIHDSHWIYDKEDKSSLTEASLSGELFYNFEPLKAEYEK